MTDDDRAHRAAPDGERRGVRAQVTGAAVGALCASYLAGAGAGLLGKGVSLLAGFANLWLLTNILSKEDFAGYVFVLALLTWLAMLGTAGLDRTVMYRLSRDRAEPGTLSGAPFVAAALWAVLPLSAVLAAAVAFGTPASGIVRLAGVGFWLAVLAPLVVTTCLGRVFEAWFVARGRPAAAILVPAAGDAARTLGLVAAFLFAPSRIGVAVGVLAAALVPMVAWLALAPARSMRRPAGLAAQDWTYGVQAMLAKATNEGAHQVDVIMLGIMATSTATADYAVAARLAPLASVGKELLSPVLMPRLARYGDEGARIAIAQEYRQVQLLALVAALAVAAVFAGFGRALLGVFDGYDTSYPLLLILAGGYVVNAGFGSNAAFLTISGHAGWTLAARVALLAGIVALNFVLIPALGALGAALSLALGMSAVNILLSTIIWRLDRLATMSGGLLVLLAAAFMLLLLGAFTRLGSLAAGVGLAAIAAVIVRAELPVWLPALRQLLVPTPALGRKR